MLQEHYAQVDEYAQFGLHDVEERYRIVRAQVPFDAVPAGRGYGKEDDPAALVLLGDGIRVVGVADVGDDAVLRMEPESNVGGVVVVGTHYLRPQARYVVGLAGSDRKGPFGKPPVVIGHHRSETLEPVHGADAAVDLPASPPSAVCHAFDGHLRVGIVIGVAVGHDDGIGLSEIITYLAHVGESTRSRVHMYPGGTRVYEETAGASGLEHGGVSAPASAQKGEFGHRPSMVSRVYPHSALLLMRRTLRNT